MCHILESFFGKIMTEWLSGIRPSWKVVARNTPSHASHHLCFIWKESTRNCRCYRADTQCGMDRQTAGVGSGWVGDGIRVISLLAHICVTRLQNRLSCRIWSNFGVSYNTPPQQAFRNMDRAWGGSQSYYEYYAGLYMLKINVFV